VTRGVDCGTLAAGSTSTSTALVSTVSLPVGSEIAVLLWPSTTTSTVSSAREFSSIGFFTFFFTLALHLTFVFLCNTSAELSELPLSFTTAGPCCCSAGKEAVTRGVDCGTLAAGSTSTSTALVSTVSLPVGSEIAVLLWPSTTTSTVSSSPFSAGLVLAFRLILPLDLDLFGVTSFVMSAKPAAVLSSVRGPCKAVTMGSSNNLACWAACTACPFRCAVLQAKKKATSAIDAPQATASKVAT